MKCLRRLLRISYLEHKTNDYVRSLVSSYVGPQEPLLTTVKRRKLAWFGHVTRHDTLSKTILQGTVEGGRRRGRQRKNWTDNVKEWTDLSIPALLTTAANTRGASHEAYSHEAYAGTTRPTSHEAYAHVT